MSRYIGEQYYGEVWDHSAVKYLSFSERQSYQIMIRNGKLYNSNGNLFDTSNASNVFTGEGTAIFVMDEYGNIYVSCYQEVGKFHHSSILSGMPAAAAGEITVSNGNILGITPKSGHYRHGEEYFNQFIIELQKCGINTDNVTIIRDGF